MSGYPYADDHRAEAEVWAQLVEAIENAFDCVPLDHWQLEGDSDIEPSSIYADAWNKFKPATEAALALAGRKFVWSRDRGGDDD